jgi:hypothetical protein
MRDLCAVAVAGLLAFAAAAEDKKGDETKKDEGGVRLIELKDVKPPMAKADAKVTVPTKIATREELVKAFGEDGAKAMKVDFTKEYLLLFQWSGSGGDRIGSRTDVQDGKSNVMFTYTPGQTRDVKPHTALFGMPAGSTYKVQ